MKENRYYWAGSSMLVTTVFALLLMVIIFAAASLNSEKFLDSGRRDKAFADTAALGGLISQYELELGKYPASLNDLTKKVGQYGPWIKEIPKDPWNKGKSYQYKTSKDGFVVFSVGKDKSASSSVAAGIKGDDVGFRGK